MSVRTVLGGLVLALVASAAPPATAVSTGTVTLSSARPATARLVVAQGQHVVTDPNPFDGPKDVRITSTGSWYAVALRGADGLAVYAAVKTPHTEDPIVFLPFDEGGLGAGTYTLTVAGDAPVSVTFDVTGGSGARRLTGRPTTGSYRDASTAGPLPVRAAGSVTSTVPAGALVVAVAGARNTLGQASDLSLCLARTGQQCDDGSFTFLSPGSSGGYSYSALQAPHLAPGRWDAVMEQTEVGLLEDPFVLAVVLGR